MSENPEEKLKKAKDKPEQEPKRQRVKSDEKLKQISAIKERLNTELTKFKEKGGSIYALLDILEKEYKFNLSYDTLNKTLSTGNTTTLDFFCVLALCRYWKLDISYILSPPDNKEKPMPEADSMISSMKYKVLDDPAYLGTYYGYLSSNKKDNTDLHKLCLNIERSKEGSFTAALTVESTVSGKNGAQPLKKELHGIPILSTLNQNIAITLTDEIGNFFFLYTNYAEYLTPRVFYRKGIAVTSAATGEREPVMQTFVLFDRPVPEKNLSYIPGLLFPPQDVVAISEDSLNALAEESPVVAQLVENFQYLIKEHREIIYDLNEVSILAEKSSMNREDRLKALALLKEKSISANKFFFTSNLAESTEFVRDYLLKL